MSTNLYKEIKLVLDRVAPEGYVLCHYTGFDLHDLCKSTSYQVLSSVSGINIVKVDKYIFASQITVYGEVLESVVIPPGVDHNEYINEMREFVKVVIGTTIYMVDKNGIWRAINNIKPNKYIYSGNSNLQPLLRKIERVNEMNKSGSHININIMLHGPPGCGKTRLVTDIAVSMGKDIYNINLDNIVVRDIKSGSVILVEELDKMLMPNGEFINPEKSSELLQLLDGVMRPLNCTIAIICNNFKRVTMNKTLCRPGRYTDIIEFGYVDETQCRSLCHSAYPGCDHLLLWERVKKLKATIAELAIHVNNSSISDVTFSDMLDGLAKGISDTKSFSNTDGPRNYM